jgi:Transposase DDE domain group 1
MGRFETEWLTESENLAALTDLPGRWIDKVHNRRQPRAIVLDMDSSESETYGDQEGSAYRSHGRQDSDRRSARVRLLNRPTLGRMRWPEGKTKNSEVSTVSFPTGFATQKFWGIFGV